MIFIPFHGTGVQLAQYIRLECMEVATAFMVPHRVRVNLHGKYLFSHLHRTHVAFRSLRWIWPQLKLAHDIEEGSEDVMSTLIHLGAAFEFLLK
jgi:hypothetical protein